MNYFSVSIFGRMTSNKSYSENFILKSGDRIIVRLYTGDSIDEGDLLKVELILKNLDRMIYPVKDKIIDLCGEDAEYEDQMKDYMDFILTECRSGNVNNFPFSSNKHNILASDFVRNLKLKSIQISLRHDSLVFDYIHDEIAGEIWAVNYDLDMKFINMTCES